MALIHVVGGGPAGSIAAISALRSGHGVVLSEEHNVAGLPRNCSGLFSRDGLGTLSPFIDYRRHVVNPIRGARISFAGTGITVRRKDAVAFVCDRAGMDRELASRAEAEGAQIRYGERIRSSFHSRNIIGADGPLSAVARHFGFPAIRQHVATLQARVPYESEEPDMIEMHLSGERFPGFFAWVIPQNAHTAEFGVGVELPNRPAAAWNRLMRMKGIAAPPKPCGFVIPILPRSKTAVRKNGFNVVLAGDAAGQVKSTTGGGVIFGGNCAALAGKYALSPARYEFEWRAKFGPDLAMHRAIHRFISSRSDPELSSIGRRIKKLNIDSYLSHHGHMDRPTKMLRPQLLAHMLKNIAGIA
ncbi:NAD(P)/FAD-dependent oxidoreductase [Candidatus Micrarchaeota archaeon]|nr:NAD(P)/FAD-dependent oxidoreductase [Candidatus Micrarchaeota archaeon]